MTKQEALEFVMPEWAKALSDGPLKLNEETDIEELIAELVRRLDALFHLHRCEPTSDGWRTLALRLALGFVFKGKQILQIVTPADAEYGGRGRPKGHMADFWTTEIEWQRRRAKPQEGELTVKEAAKRVHKKYRRVNIMLRQRGEPEEIVPTYRTLENIYSAAKSGPENNKRLPWSTLVHLLMDQAALQLQKKSRESTILP